LEGIPCYGFSNCPIKSIRVPITAEFIENFCFTECKFLSDIKFEPASRLKKLGRRAFGGCRLETIEIPLECQELTGLSLSVFKFVTIARGNMHFGFNEGFLVNIAKKSLIRAFRQANQVSIKNDIEIISDGCFALNKAICEVIFEPGSKLKEFGSEAFIWSGLKSIWIPGQVEEIGESCFYLCADLCEVVFEPNSKLKRIGHDAFGLSSIQSIEIPGSVERIGERCFADCRGLREVVFESGCKLTRIGRAAFSGCPLEYVRIPEGCNLKHRWPKGCHFEYVKI
jgi:hypothetical protein